MSSASSSSIRVAMTFQAFLTQCARVLRITRKPTAFEFKTIVKISAIGMAVIGLIGFVLHLLKEVLIR